MTGSSQFSPQQVLLAGRRAESDGKHDYAVKFYQHILSQHGETAEAQEASVALHRLDATRSANTASPVPSQSSAQMPGPQRKLPRGVAAAAGMRDHVPPVRPVTDDAGSGALSGRRMRRAKPAKHVRRPRLKRYRIGRFMSGLLGMMGLIAAIGGLVSAGANVMLVVLNTPNAALSILATSPLVAGGLIAIACVLILLGQMANATFDAAAAGARMSVAGEEHDGA